MEAESAAEAPEPEEAETTEAADAPRGVIRLLMAGHFKGVADVVLRINFHDEIVALQNQAVGPAAESSADELVQTVDAQVEQVLGAGTLTDEQAAAVGELQQTFHLQVDSLREEFAASGDADALRAGLQSAFDELMAALNDLLLPPEEPPAEEALVEEVSADTVEPSGEQAPQEAELPAEPGAALGELLAALAEAGNAVLEAMDEALAGVSVLPPLSPPQGNGAAYGKFLAVYNELYGLGAPPEPEAGETASEAEPAEAPCEPLDVAA